MRAFVLSLAVIAAACSPKTEEKQPGHDAAQTTQGQTTSAPAAAFPINAQIITGTWSFDKSCASGDGMTLELDGVAAFDEWGIGSWRVENGRLVLDLATQEPGMDPDPNAPRQIKTFEASAPVTERLAGTLQPDGRVIDAVRCPNSP